MARKIKMQFPLGGDPYLLDTAGFGKTCEAHISEVARLAGADVTLMCPLPDLEKEPEVNESHVDYVQENA